MGLRLWDIIKTVGSSVISNTVPGGSLIIDGINELLPDDKKLPVDATGDQVSDAINSLPPEQQADILMKEYDVQIKAYDSLQTMIEANSRSLHTTRPKIAYQSFQVVAFSTLSVVFAWCYAVITGNSDMVDMVDMVERSWLFILGAVGPLVTVLHAYFGVLTHESKDRLNAAQGHKVDPVGGLFKKLFP